LGRRAGAHGDGQGVDLGALDEVHRLVRVGQQLGVIQHALGTVAVLGLAHAGLEAAQHAELTLDRHAAAVGHLGDAAGDVDIVLVAGGGLGVLLQRAVHHHRGEAVLDGGGAGGRAVAVVLVHAHRDVRVELDQGVDQAGQHHIIGVAARPAAGLDDDRRIDRVGRLHDGEALFHVVDVVGGQPVAMLGGMVEQLPQRDARHADLS